MLSLESAAAFFVTAIVLGLAPGPDNLFVITQSALYGARAGLAVTCGLISGLFVHTAAVALGVAALISHSPLAFGALKTVGAAYLLYLAWQIVRSEKNEAETGAAAETPEKNALSLFALYRRGIIMNVTNPKVTLFFLAFLPQFVNPERGHTGWQIVSLGLLFQLATLIVFGSLALMAARIAARFMNSSGGRKWLNRISVCVFVALALSLLFS